jgi:hypothetical protein
MLFLVYTMPDPGLLICDIIEYKNKDKGVL